MESIVEPGMRLSCLLPVIGTVLQAENNNARPPSISTMRRRVRRTICVIRTPLCCMIDPEICGVTISPSGGRGFPKGELPVWEGLVALPVPRLSCASVC